MNSEHVSFQAPLVMEEPLTRYTSEGGFFATFVPQVQFQAVQ